MIEVLSSKLHLEQRWIQYQFGSILLRWMEQDTAQGRNAASTFYGIQEGTVLTES